MSRDQNAGQNSNIQVGNISFESVEQNKYMGITLTNQNCVPEEMKSRLKSGDACYIILCRIFCLPVCYSKV